MPTEEKPVPIIIPPPMGEKELAEVVLDRQRAETTYATALKRYAYWVGPAILAVRTSLGLTQAQMAEALDVSDGFISNMETGKQTPSIVIAEKILDLQKRKP